MRKAIFAAALAIGMTVSSAYAVCSIPNNCKPCNSAAGETNGCVEGTATTFIAGNAQTVNGCVCVNGVAATKDGTTITPNATDQQCTQAATKGCNGQ